jgi:hypothetical protein
LSARSELSGAAPFGGRQVGVERHVDLLTQAGLNGRQDAARDRRVAPDERLAIVQQRLVNRTDRIGEQQVARVRIALLRPKYRFTRGVLQQLGSQPAHGQGAGARLVEPALTHLATRDERERQRVSVHAAADGQVEDQADACAQRGRLERLARAQRHARRHGRERGRRALVKSGKHAAAELTPLAAERQRGAHFVKRDRSRTRRQKIEVFDQAALERDLRGAREHLRRDAVEWRRTGARGAVA